MYDEEEWAPIEEFPHYLVSSHGRVRRVDREARSIKANERGFPVVLLYSATSGARYLRQLNRLVAAAFCPPPDYPDQQWVWHRDGDLMNCHYLNLEWDTKARVEEWNDMHREGYEYMKTAPVMVKRNGEIYHNAYACALAEGILESTVLKLIDVLGSHSIEQGGKYRFVSPEEYRDAQLVHTIEST